MIGIGLHIVLLIMLSIAFYQDQKYRAISWIIFPVLSLLSIGIFFQWDFSLKNIGLNLLFLTIVLFSLTLYLSIKEKKIVNIINGRFGLGDILFLLAVTPLFGNENYILFFISGMFLSAIFHLIISRGNLSAKIPLAGYLALYIILLKGANLIVQPDIFYTAFIQ